MTMTTEIAEKVKGSTLDDEVKEQLLKLLEAKVPYHRRPETIKKSRENRMEKYRNDPEFRERLKARRRQHYHRKTGCEENRPPGRKKLYESEEAKRLAYNEHTRERCHERRQDVPRQRSGPKPMSKEENILRFLAKINEDQ